MKGLDTLLQMVQLLSDWVRQVIPDLLLKVLADGGDLLEPEIPGEVKAGLQVWFGGQSLDIDAIVSWEDADCGFDSHGIVAINALEDPVQDPGVLSKARPQELALKELQKNGS